VRTSLLFLLALLLTGCPTNSPNDDDAADDDDGANDDDDSALSVFDLDGEGPRTTASVEGSFTTTGGCVLDYSDHHPTEDPTAPLVVLAHGFQRSGAQMVGLADHLATWGLRVVVPDLCHSTFADSDPEANGEEMVELAASLQPTEAVAYVGYSAGGLAALIAASQDTRTSVLVGLDLVDNGPGAAAAAALTAPAYGMFGEPSACNSQSNGVAILQGASTSSLGRLTDADHCDFEDPTDATCLTLCENTSATVDQETIGAVMRAMMTAPLMQHLAGFSDAAIWWHGEEATALADKGLWTPL